MTIAAAPPAISYLSAGNHLSIFHAVRDGRRDFGVLLSPGQGAKSVLAHRIPYALDNGAYGMWATLAEATPKRRYLLFRSWYAWIDRFADPITTDCHPPRFVALPDVPGDSKATRELTARYLPEVDLYQGALPFAYVAQDGCVEADIPWDQISWLFLGGSTAFKVGEDAERLVRAATARGIGTHMGRVNGLPRMRRAQEMGCVSVDGRHLVYQPDAHAAEVLSWLDLLNS